MTAHKQTISKADAANRQLDVAIRMYLSGGDRVAVHTLACAAREIYEKHCKMAGIQRFYDEIAATYPDSTQKQVFDILNSTRNFLKHPDADGNQVFSWRRLYQQGRLGVPMSLRDEGLLPVVLAPTAPAPSKPFKTSLSRRLHSSSPKRAPKSRHKAR
ncbi:hypothetical protein GTP56_06040 [Duganella sp. FT134W]|uniref:Uncharacterized protein n=1 Tax=Duganella margarita TaxID=2692170 RepID=A0A7X4GY16_9BURK|nr:hypothetical protein [Duganella margarita]MYM71758.1 hypothetical protein [Duganella margarita]